MRPLSEIAKALGLNENAPDSTKRSLIRHLERHLGQLEIPTAPPSQIEDVYGQLSFDLSESEIPKKKPA